MEIAALLVAILTLVATVWPLAVRNQKRNSLKKAWPHPTLKSTPKNKSKLRIGVYPYPPLMNGTNKPDGFEGIWIDLGKSISSALQQDYELQLYLMSDLISQHPPPVDIALALFRTVERSKKFDFSRPVHRIGLQGLCRTETPDITPEALANGEYKVIVQEGEVGWEYAKKDLSHLWKRKSISVIKSLKLEETMNLVASGTYDLAIHDELTCVEFLKNRTTEDLRLAFEKPLKIFDVAVALNRASHLDREEIDNIVVSVRNQSEFKELEAEAIRGFEQVIQKASLQ